MSSNRKWCTHCTTVTDGDDSCATCGNDKVQLSRADAAMAFLVNLGEVGAIAFVWDVEQITKLLARFSDVNLKGEKLHRQWCDMFEMAKPLCRNCEKNVVISGKQECETCYHCLNGSMARKVVLGECINLDEYGKYDESGDHNLGKDFVVQKDVDYCWLSSGRWVWSIGRKKDTGEIIASTTPDLYQATGYDCLFLR